MYLTLKNKAAGFLYTQIVTANQSKRISKYILDHSSNQVNGFTCPEAQAGAAGFSDPHPKYADPDDCAKFYICLNGISPRAQGCELGLVYNTLTKQCDSPENVAEW